MSKLILEVDDNLLKDIKAILNSVGIDIDIAFNIFVKKIIKEKGLPFSLKQTENTNQTLTSTDNEDSSNIETFKKRRSNNVITTIMIEEVWDAFKSYIEGFKEVGNLSDFVSKKSGMSRGSAFIYLNILIRLSEGEINKRAMKPSDFEFFLNKFRQELGIKQYKNAINSIQISIPYWNGNNSTFATNMKALLKKLE